MINDSTVSAEIAENRRRRRHRHTHPQRRRSVINRFPSRSSKVHTVLSIKSGLRFFFTYLYIYIYVYLAYLHTTDRIPSHPTAVVSPTVNREFRCSFLLPLIYIISIPLLLVCLFFFRGNFHYPSLFTRVLTLSCCTATTYVYVWCSSTAATNT